MQRDDHERPGFVHSPRGLNGFEDEPPLVTSGDDLTSIAQFLNGRPSYTASDVIDYLLRAGAA